MRSITVSGTTLFHLAAEHLGDASQWWRIARQNGLVGPEVGDVVTLQLPDRDDRQRDKVPTE